MCRPNRSIHVVSATKCTARDPCWLRRSEWLNRNKPVTTVRDVTSDKGDVCTCSINIMTSCRSIFIRSINSSSSSSSSSSGRCTHRLLAYYSTLINDNYFSLLLPHPFMQQLTRTGATKVRTSYRASIGLSFSSLQMMQLENVIMPTGSLQVFAPALYVSSV